MTDRLAAALRTTPRTSTSKRSTPWPLTTVNPCPFIPGLTSLTGRIPEARAEAPTRVSASAAAAT